MFRRKERIACWIAWHPPRLVVYWAFTRMAVEGVNEYPGDQKVLDVMKRWSVQ